MFVPGFMHILGGIMILFFSTDLPDGNYALLKKTGAMTKEDPYSVILNALANYRRVDLAMHAPVVPVQIEKLRIFRTVFWVSLRENYEITGSTGMRASTFVTKRSNGTPVDTSRKPSKAHPQERNVSPPTKANSTTHRQPAEHATMHAHMNLHCNFRAYSIQNMCVIGSVLIVVLVLANNRGFDTHAAVESMFDD